MPALTAWSLCQWLALRSPVFAWAELICPSLRTTANQEWRKDPHDSGIYYHDRSNFIKSIIQSETFARLRRIIWELPCIRIKTHEGWNAKHDSEVSYTAGSRFIESLLMSEDFARLRLRLRLRLLETSSATS